MTSTTVTTTVPATTATTTATRTVTTTATRRRVRAASVVGTAVAAAAVFAAGRTAGADFTITDPKPGAVPHTFVLPEIAIVTLVIGLAGWATLACLERFTSRARAVWSVLATTIVLLSLVPIWIEVATTQTRVWLAVVHVVVGLGLAPMVRVPTSSVDSARRS
jgi:hypothetical protein